MWSMRSVSNRLFLSFLLLLSLFSFSVVSEATDFGTLSVTGGGSSASIGRGVFTGVETVATAGGGASLKGEFQLLLKRRPYTLTALRGISGSAIVQGALKGMKALGPLGLAFTVGQIVWDPILGLWTKPEGDASYPAGRWCVLKGYPEETCTSSPSSSCSSYFSTYITPNQPTRIFVGVERYDDNFYSCLECVSNSSCSTPNKYVNTQRYTSCPVGYIWNSQTGLCQQMQYVPASDTDLINAITPPINSSASTAASQTSKNADNDEPGTVSQAGPVTSITGPSTIPPDVTTETKVSEESIPDQDNDGQPELQTTTTTITTTTSYSITYNNSSVQIQEHTQTQTQTQTSVTYSSTNQTTVVNNNTTTTNTTNESTDSISNPEQPDTTDSTASDWPAFCSWAAVVCSFIDWMKQEPSLPDAPVLPVEDISTGNQPFVLNVGSGQCPANIQVALPQGKSYVWSYQPLCDTLTNYIHPIVLLMSAILSVYILAGVKVD